MTGRQYSGADRSGWLEAARRGEPEAMYNLGTVAFYSERDVDAAERWLREAAEAGYVEAMYQLGVVLATVGEKWQAELWFLRSAEAGNAEAMSNLVLLYTMAGRPGEADRWRHKAAEAGHPLDGSPG